MKAAIFALTASLAAFARADSCSALTDEHGHARAPKTRTVYVDYTPSTSSVQVPSTSAVSPAETKTAAAVSAAVTTASVSVAAPSTMKTVVLSSSTSAPVVVVVPTTSSTSTPAAVPTTSSSTSAAAHAAATAASSSSKSTASTDSSSVSIVGEATFYGGNVVGGACSLSAYTLPSSLFGTAYSGAVWDNAANCGRCVQVTGPSGSSIKAMIVDECPECAEGHLDLFQNAFAELADISKGVISTSYSFVECGISSPIVLHSKSGTSAYWFSMQVINANEGVAKFEVSTDGGSTWQSTTRSDYNFFENASGFGTSTVDVRITSTSGTTIEVSSVSVASDSQTTASSNFA
ncbi:extracellular cellulase [Grosmannia clavigera kw1407]|uniref:Extracellular cellulase n=1 Tax=Grosmannia clavigera (strain kw1407 / UAMH 11150) TaxID=655863 RepID=F0X6Y6_GROCL|nr:extracellular cellulase [Grosmannia clavigera kw1407]EFX06552.1 extracellular cellulase [Grosmannia clavigera kw1407]